MKTVTKNRLIFLFVPVLFGTSMLFSQDWKDAAEFESAVTKLFDTIDQKVPGTETPDQLYNVIKKASEAKAVHGKRATGDNGKHLDQNFEDLLKNWVELDQSITVRVRLFIYHKITHGKSQKVINQTVDGIEKLATYYKETFIPIFMAQADFKSNPTLFDSLGFARQADTIIAEANHAASLAESTSNAAATAAATTAAPAPAPAAPPGPDNWDEEKFVPAVTKLFNIIEEQIGISRGQVYIPRGVVQSPEQLYKIIKTACEAKDVQDKRATDDEGKHLGEASGYPLLKKWENLDLRIAAMVKSFIFFEEKSGDKLKLIKNGINPAAIKKTIADLGTLATYYRNNFIPIFMTQNGISKWSSPDGFARQCATIQGQAAQAAQTTIERFGKSAERPAPEQKSALEQKGADISGAVTTIRQGIERGRPNEIERGLDTLRSFAENNPDLATAVAALTEAIDSGEEDTRDIQFAIITSLATSKGKAPKTAGEGGPLPTIIGIPLVTALAMATPAQKTLTWAAAVLANAKIQVNGFTGQDKNNASALKKLLDDIIKKLDKTTDKTLMQGLKEAKGYLSGNGPVETWN